MYARELQAEAPGFLAKNGQCHNWHTFLRSGCLGSHVRAVLTLTGP